MSNLKYLFLILVFAACVQCQPDFDELQYGSSIEEEVYIQEIFSIKEPTWIFKSGMSKGRHHDRQDLGLIVPKDTKIRFRQINPEFTESLTVRLIGDDTSEDIEIYVWSDWVELTGKVPLVPFVDTPYDTCNATLEYSLIGPAQPLLVYKQDDNETEFFKKWDHYDTSYTLIKHNYFQLLIPKQDKNLARDLSAHGYNSLDKLIYHYDDLFRSYNHFAGLDKSSPTNQYGENRYFLRVDKNSKVGAYYGNYWTAASGSSAKMWLTTTWGHHQQIGRGYQPSFTGMYVSEASNNIFGTLFECQTEKLTWIFNYNDHEKYKKEHFNANMVKTTAFEKHNERDKLILFMTLTEKANKQGLINIYKAHRAAANNGSKHEQRLPELLNRYYSDHAWLDFAPVLNSMDLAPEPREAQRNRQRGYRPIAFLAQVVPPESLPAARVKLDPYRLITTDYQLVNNRDIEFLGMHGNLILKQLENNGFRNLNGITIKIKDGNKVVAEKTIECSNGFQQLQFDKIPNGVYSVEFSGSSILTKEANLKYVYVKQKVNEFYFKFEIVNDLTSQEIQLYGQRGNFAQLKTNTNTNTAQFTVTTTAPHPSYARKVYASIKVTDAAGKIKYEQNMEGTKLKKLNNNITLNENDVIMIYHAEPRTRLRSDDDIINHKLNTNKWVVTKHGLRNVDMQQDPQFILTKKIDALAETILKDKEIRNQPIDVSYDKKQLLAAINLLDEQNQVAYTQKYESILTQTIIKIKTEHDELFQGVAVEIKKKDTVLKKSQTKKNIIFLGNIANATCTFDLSIKSDESGTATFNQDILNKSSNNFSVLSNQNVTFRGLYGEFAELKTSMAENLVYFTSLEKPHVYFRGLVYISVRITDSLGTIKYDRQIDGEEIRKWNDQIVIKENDIVEIYQAEAFRMRCDENIININRLTNKCKVTKFGLKNLDIDHDPQLLFMTKIDETANIALKFQRLNKSYVSFAKEVLTAINLLEKPYRLMYLEKYSCLLPNSEHKKFGNKIALLKKDNQIIKEIAVVNNTFSIQNVSNGFYVVELSSKNTKIEKQNKMKEITEYLAEDIKLENRTKTRLIDSNIQFLGLANHQFGELETYLSNDYATLRVFLKDPHVYFDSLYFAINITDEVGLLTYFKEINGRNAPKIYDRFFLKENYTVSIYHAEVTSRLLSNDTVINTQITTNKWLVTKYGLQNLNVSSFAQQELMSKIDKIAPLVIKDIERLKPAILSLEEPYRKYFIVTYADIFPPNALNQISTEIINDRCFDKSDSKDYKTKLQTIKEINAETRKTVKLMNDLLVAILSLEEQHVKLFKNKYKALFGQRDNYKHILPKTLPL